jgi:hypothetical protein
MKLDRRQKRTARVTIRISDEMKRAACDLAVEQGTTLSKTIVNVLHAALQSEPGRTDVRRDRRRAG